MVQEQSYSLASIKHATEYSGGDINLKKKYLRIVGEDWKHNC
jgi:hypothetical protein